LEQLYAEAPVHNPAVRKGMVMLIGIIGAALGAGGAVALLGGRSNPAVQIGGAQVRPVVLDQVHVAQKEIVKRALNYVKLESHKAHKKVLDGRNEVTWHSFQVSHKGVCEAPTLEDFAFMENAWFIHVENDVTTLRPYKHPDRCLTVGNAGIDLTGKCEDSLKHHGMVPVVFDGQYLYPQGQPNRLACCRQGHALKFTDFGAKDFPGPDCEWFVRPVVGGWDFSGRYSKDSVSVYDFPEDDDDDDF